MKQAQAADGTGVAFLALIVHGMPGATDPLRPRPGRRRETRGRTGGKRAARPAQTACRPGHGFAGLGDDIR